MQLVITVDGADGPYLLIMDGAKQSHVSYIRDLMGGPPTKPVRIEARTAAPGAATRERLIRAGSIRSAEVVR